MPFYARYSGSTQRARILDAMTRIAAEHGFDGATVSSIVSAAGVSRSTFYEHFAGKTECLLSAYESATDIALSTVTDVALAQLDSGTDEALTAAINAYFQLIREDSATAKVVFVEVLKLGSAGIAARAEAQQRYVAQLQTLLTTMGHDDVPLTAVALIMAGVEDLVTQALQAENLPALGDIEDATLALLRDVVDT